METLQIEIPKGYQVKSFDQKTGQVKFEKKPKPVKERIKTFDDVLKEVGISKSHFMIETEDMEKDEKAYKQVKLIAEALNEGWTPDWENHSEYKYYPYFKMGSPSGVGFSFFSSSITGTRFRIAARAFALNLGN